MSEFSSSSSHPRSGAHHVHLHVHGAESPHPPQPAPWSILRMGLVSRVAAAAAASAVLWALVLLAMR
ncbi:hypothetical protein [Rhodopseudomonas sp. BR0M22]|uniref:hypothetical protein n=1 Tax=Rhodopseudomonas sp. BR0M22 TaxID=2269369 RepID=UPI0013DFC1CE|nr:hypothetical protein [Rhodopseudomonas sp. BR0M22]MCD0417180.1 hypothetical protein [Rubrivivax sp. JA1024]NEW93443.1 hypothetical protein [Rhodopseudomonas sp. BR0M22]